MTSRQVVRKVGGRVLRRLGVDPVPTASLRNPLERRRRVLVGLKVDLVIDVGANDGEYGAALRRLGYRGRIVSFEPLLEPFERLARHVEHDPGWQAIHSAIGPAPGQATINVAANQGASSSFLPALKELEDNAPEARYVRTEQVTVRRLDEACSDAVRGADAAFLKVDVQGYELQVLDSATQLLRRIVGLQLEMSLVPLYSGAPTLTDVLDRAQSLGFELVGLEPGLVAADGRLLQADGLFKRRK